MGDVDDVEIYVAQPIHEWQQTECGQWCMAHATNHHWLTGFDPNGWGYRISIVGELPEQDHTYFQLKWSNHVKK